MSPAILWYSLKVVPELSIGVVQGRCEYCSRRALCRGRVKRPWPPRMARGHLPAAAGGIGGRWVSWPDSPLAQTQWAKHCARGSPKMLLDIKDAHLKKVSAFGNRKPPQSGHVGRSFQGVSSVPATPADPEAILLDEPPLIERPGERR